jgi:hypothetical protein
MLSQSSRAALVALSMTLSWAGVCGGQSVRFDAPAYIECFDSCDPEIDVGRSTRLIRLPLEIAAEIRLAKPEEISTLVFQVASLDRAVTVHDFAPRNVIDSEIAGLISVEKTEENTATSGLKADATPSFAATSAQAGLTGKQGEVTRYQKKPPQDLLVASGYFGRQSGVFFKLHRGSRPSLEGTHPLSLILRVPESWRTGILRVQASAVRSKAGMFGGEPTVESPTLFAVPFFLAADDEARSRAGAYQSAEFHFRRLAHQALAQPSRPDFADQIKSLFSKSPAVKLDQAWIQQMLLSFDPQVADRYDLPKDLSIALKEFQLRKQQFLRLAAADTRSVSRK